MSNALKITPSDLSSRTNIIGVSGPARVGKDTAGEYLVNKGYRHLSFAIHLKRAISAMLGYSLDEVDRLKVMDKTHVPGFNVTMRHMQQTLGTEWGRDLIDPDMWVKCTEIEMLSGNNPKVVITDVRFENEAAWVRKMNGLVVHLSRNDRELTDNPGHASEAGIEFREGDIRVGNNGNVADLHFKIDEILNPSGATYDWMAS